MTGDLGPAGRIVRAFIESKLTPLLVLTAIALGAFAVMNTPREEEPQIVVPMVDVFVELPGASAEEVENRLTIPLEKRMWEIPGVEYVYSVSMPGRAMTIVRFVVGEEEEASLVKVYEKLASGMDRIPRGASPPLVKARSIDDVPVLALTFWSETRDDFEMRSIAAEVKRELSQLDGLSEMTLIGGRRRLLSVYLDPSRMTMSGVDIPSVLRAISGRNAAARAGTFDRMDRQVIVEVDAFLKSAEDVGGVVVGVHEQRPIYLRDIAEIEDGAEEIDRLVLHMQDVDAAGGKNHAGGLYSALTLAVSKRKGVDAAHVVDNALNKIEEMRGRLIPGDVKVSISRNYGETASEKAGELLKHLLGAILSVTVVIALFLGWRGGLVVFISVPVTFALTLFVYYILGYTLNRVTLFALIFVTGIVVDDSIIVVENIVRHLSFTKKRALAAAIDAVNEVGNPTILATLTVIAAVVPMAFVRGLMGPYMRPMPVGATLAMTFSLLVALIAAPWFAYRLLKGPSSGEGGPVRESSGEVEEGDTRHTLTYRIYRAIVSPMLDRPALRWGFLAFVFLLLAGSVALFPMKLVTVKMLPFDNKSEMQVVIDMPEGTSLEQTRRVAVEIAQGLQTVPEVADTQIYVGTASPVNFNGLVRHYDLRQSAHMADIQVNLDHKTLRDRKSHDIAKSIRPIAEKIGRRYGASIKIAEVPPGPPVASTLVAEIYGPNDEERLALAKRVKTIFEETDGVVDVDWYVEAPQVEQHFVVDGEKSGLHGVSAGEIAQSLSAALGGTSAGLLHVPEAAEDIPIEVRLRRHLRSNTAELGALPMRAREGRTVDLAEVSHVEERASEPYRYRKNLRPVVYVTGDVSGEAESPVYAILDMAAKIDKLETSSGAGVEQFYRDEPWSEDIPSVKWDGEWQITYEVFRDLGAAFAVVMVLIYILIIGWFKSFKVPLVMMISIPLSLVGILPAHALMGFFFTATSMIGFIALAGIMVRNAVLLIDFIDLAVARGRGLKDAVLEGGAVRFRPILLTAGTVVVGAIVILFDPIFEGLAISLIAGSLASTVLTLVVVPVVYYMIQRDRRAA